MCVCVCGRVVRVSVCAVVRVSVCVVVCVFCFQTAMSTEGMESVPRTQSILSLGGGSMGEDMSLYASEAWSRQVTLAWEGIGMQREVVDPVKGGKVLKTILQGIDGLMTSGKMMAVMGPSGRFACSPNPLTLHTITRVSLVGHGGGCPFATRGLALCQCLLLGTDAPLQERKLPALEGEEDRCHHEQE